MSKNISKNPSKLDARKRVIKVLVNNHEYSIVAERARTGGFTVSGFARYMALQGNMPSAKEQKQAVMSYVASAILEPETKKRTFDVDGVRYKISKKRRG